MKAGDLVINETPLALYSEFSASGYRAASHWSWPPGQYVPDHIPPGQLGVIVATTYGDVSDVLIVLFEGQLIGITDPYPLRLVHGVEG